MLKIMFQVAICVAVLGGLPQAAQAFISKQKLNCRSLDFIKKKYLVNHILHSKAERKLEIRTAKQMVQYLDPSKIYFLEKDVRLIQSLMTGVFKRIQASNCRALQTAYGLYKTRLAQRVKFAKAYLGHKSFKVNKKVSLVIDADKIPWSKTSQAADAYHRKYLQFQVATRLTGGDTSLAEAKKLVLRHYDRTLRRANSISQPKLLEWYLDAFSLALDPHSSYFSPADLDDFKVQMDLSLEGIGATLKSEDGFTVIHQLIPGGAAASSMKLQAEDKIMAVAQGRGPFENIVEEELQDVVQKIRGERGTQVRLQILRKKGKKTTRFEVSLIRRKIQVDEARAAIYYKTYKRRGKNIQVALIEVPSFYMGQKGRSVTNDVKNLLAEARAKGVKSVVLDLSTNGGGALEDAVSVTGLFVRRGAVVKQSSNRMGRRHMVLSDGDPGLEWSGPLVVLTSPASASASEIVAGALQDYKRAVVVGGKSTFGKGSVQSVEPLRANLGAIKTTVGLYFIPGGNSTQQIGVRSDVVLPSPYDSSTKLGEKTLEYSLPARRVKPFLSTDVNIKAQKGGVRPWKRLSMMDLKSLQKQSALRVKKSKKFKDIREEVAKNLKRGHSVNLGELLDDEDDDDDEDKKDKKSDTQHKTPEEAYAQQKKERVKKYLKRADVLEAIEVAADLYARQSKR